MNRKALQKLIQTSEIITADEKQYWLGHLPAMNAEQTAKLEEILSQPTEIPFQKEIQAYFDALAKAADAALKNGTIAA